MAIYADILGRVVRTRIYMVIYALAMQIIRILPNMLLQ